MLSLKGSSASSARKVSKFWALWLNLFKQSLAEGKYCYLQLACVQTQKNCMYFVISWILLYWIDSIHARVGRVETKGLKATISQKYQNNLVYLDGLRIYSGALTSLTIMHTKHLACFQGSLYPLIKEAVQLLKEFWGGHEIKPWTEKTTTVPWLRRLKKQLQGHSPARDQHQDPLAQSARKWCHCTAQMDAVTLKPSSSAKYSGS